MTNVFEVCQWLVLERPDILKTANQMHASLDSSTPWPAKAPKNNNEDKVSYHYSLCSLY